MFPQMSLRVGSVLGWLAPRSGVFALDIGHWEDFRGVEDRACETCGTLMRLFRRALRDFAMCLLVVIARGIGFTS